MALAHTSYFVGLHGVSQTRLDIGDVAVVPVASNPEPARVVGSLALLIDVLRDIAARPPETLSASEADLQALFDDQTQDLLAIFDRAKDEMIAETATAARAGVA